MPTTKPKPSTEKALTKIKPKPAIRKPDGPPKIILGGGRNMAWISDTLFDEDLKS